MKGLNCSREREVFELQNRGQWPDACSAELRAHIESCRSCSELLLVSRTIQAAKKQSISLPRLESPGAIWWRAQLRRRNAAIETVTRPIVGAQIFALAVAFFVVTMLLVWQGSALKAWLHELPGALHLDALVPDALSQSGSLMWVMLPVLATIVLLGGVVVYLSTEKQ